MVFLMRRVSTLIVWIFLGAVPALSCQGKVGRWDWGSDLDAKSYVSTTLDVGKGTDDPLDSGMFQFTFVSHGESYANFMILDNPLQRMVLSVDGIKQVEITEMDKGEWVGQRFDLSIAALRSGKRITMDYVANGRAFTVDFNDSDFSKAYEAAQTPCH